MIQDVRNPGARRRSESALAELRRCAEEADEAEREAAELSAALADRRCERARLEERLASVATAEDPAPAIADPAAARAELDEAVRELALLGPVDETADRREQELLAELAVLTPLLHDLGGTRVTLAGFIRQMEQYTSRVFAGTRDLVEARFREHVGILFQGGEARLQSRDPAPGADGPPGVDIRVKLPRKPETSLALLSGGERSLAGLALVLSLAAGLRDGDRETGRLLILDEVDAALVEG
jgi:chromosome segregation protein